MITGIIAKKFLKYTKHKKGCLKKRRALFALNNKYKKNKRVLLGPDEFYGLAEPLLDILPEDEFQIKKHEFIQQITLSEASKIILEHETRDQAHNQKWFSERRNRLTASNFGKICKMRPQTSCKSTVHNILYSNTTTKAMEYGKNTEEIALKYLEKEIGKQIKQCGLVVDQYIPYLAATPGKLFFLKFLYSVKKN